MQTQCERSEGKRSANLVLQSLFQHLLLLTGEVQQHGYGSDQLKCLMKEDAQGHTGLEADLL